MMRPREILGIFLKGLGMGAANIVPGVSGGTIALITGIYPRLIQALRHASQPRTVKAALAGKWKDAWEHADGMFIAVLGAGVVVSILTLARAFDFLLANYETPTMAFFFGLVAVSVLQVGKTVGRWDGMRIGIFVAGTAIAAGLAFVAPAGANAAVWYLLVCGVAAICSMILPGLSGSFVLMLMGNYLLVVRAIKEFDLGILLPLGIGCGAGLLGFVQLLGWALKKAPDTVVALMTGFVFGSLLTIWPWKETLITRERVAGEIKDVAVGYEWHLPDPAQPEFLAAMALMIGGGAFLHVVHARSLEVTPAA